MKNYPDVISLEEAQDILSKIPKPIGTTYVHLTKAYNRVISEDIITDENLPPFDRSPYDGYAFLAADTIGAIKDNPVVLKITEEIPAGHFPSHAILSGETAKILTGAPIPLGADTVVKYENVVRQGEFISIFKPQSSGDNIVYKGEDLKSGEIIAKRGTPVSPPIIGLLASVGKTNIPVYQIPKVAIVSTGDELLDVEQKLKPGMIRNSSKHTIQAYLQKSGVEAFYAGTAPDKVEETAELIKEALRRSDVVITTGGVSVGDYDIIRFAVELIGAKILFWKVAIRPGGAVLAAVLDGKLILGLSGNPAAALLALHLLALPYLRILSGQTSKIQAGDKIDVYLLEEFKKPSPVRRFIWGKLIISNGQAYFSNTGRQGNAILHTLCNANLLGEIPAGSPPLEKGTMIKAHYIG